MPTAVTETPSKSSAPETHNTSAETPGKYTAEKPAHKKSPGQDKSEDYTHSAQRALEGAFLAELRKILIVEEELTQALPKLAKLAESTELQKAITDHAHETKNHVTRLQSIF